MKLVARAVLVALMMTSPAPVFALGTETFGNAPAVKQPGWADGVINVVNLNSRVYSNWVNGNEYFFYRGDVKALNEAVEKFAAVRDDGRRLVLMPGSGKTRTFGGKAVEFDWQLHVPGGIYSGVTGEKHATLTVFVNTARSRAIPERKAVEKWIGDLDSDLFQTRDAAEKALAKLGPDAKPFLRAALKAGPAAETRLRIEGLLGRLRDYDVSDLEIPKGVTVVTVDDLLTLHFNGLKATNETVCGLAMSGLSALAPYSDRVVPALIEMLKNDRKEYVRRVAAGSLAGVGAGAKAAVPTLRDGLLDPDAGVVAAFRAAIERIEAAADTPEQKAEVERKRLILKDINEFKKTLP